MSRACGLALLVGCVLLTGCRSAPKPGPRMNIKVGFDPTQPTLLCDIMETLGSDKGSTSGRARHDYTKYYAALFAKVRYEPLRIFEMGIGSNDLAIPSNMGAFGQPGASLRGWKIYFPRAMVFGADVDRKILFHEDRIETFFCDMTKPEVIAELWRAPALSAPLDVIIDDGLHTFAAQTTLLEHSLHKLAEGGVYIVEDVAGETIPRFEAKVEEWKQRFASLALASRIIVRPNANNTMDNNLLVLQRTR
jgi:hypothetical protein